MEREDGRFRSALNSYMSCITAGGDMGVPLEMNYHHLVAGVVQERVEHIISAPSRAFGTSHSDDLVDPVGRLGEVEQHARTKELIRLTAKALLWHFGLYISTHSLSIQLATATLTGWVHGSIPSKQVGLE